MLVRVFILLICIGLVGCNYQENSFKLKITHQSKTSKSNMQFTLNKRKIRVEIHEKNFPFGKKSSSYERSIDKSEAQTVIAFLETLKLDTLKSVKVNDNINEGVATTIDVKLPTTNRKVIVLDNTNTPTTELLYKYIDKLVEDRNFRFGLQNE